MNLTRRMFPSAVSLVFTFCSQNSFAQTITNSKAGLPVHVLSAVNRIEDSTDYRFQYPSWDAGEPFYKFTDSEGNDFFANQHLSLDSQAYRKNLIVITDLEPDDRIALNLLAARFGERLKFVGTTVMNAWRKKVLAEQYLKQLGLTGIKVYVGTGGRSTDYPDIASSRAAREYENEGHTILSDQQKEQLSGDKLPRGARYLQERLEAVLKNSAESKFKMEIILLAPPTDLVAVLAKDPNLKSGIGHIHIMGGWVEAPTATAGVTEKRTTYNWNMDPKASAQLMAMADIPMTLYSSHIIKPSFSGGSISPASHPEIIRIIESSRAPSLLTFRTAGASWDHHLIEKIPPLQKVIGENAGRQFTPADPLVVVGMLNPKITTSSAPVNIEIDLKNVDQARGYKVNVNENPQSKIQLVTAIDSSLFASELLEGLKVVDLKFSKTASTQSGAIRCSGLLRR